MPTYARPSAAHQNHAKILKKKKLPSITAYNYLSRRGANTTVGSGYNTILTSRPTVPEPVEFGNAYTFDMPLLSTQSLSSTLLGRVRGTYTFVDQNNGKVIFVSESFIVDNGASLGGLNGTFSAVGLEYIGLNSTKPIVGGTDDFTLATGIAITYPLADSGTDSNGNLFFWFKYEFIFA